MRSSSSSSVAPPIRYSFLVLFFFGTLTHFVFYRLHHVIQLNKPNYSLDQPTRRVPSSSSTTTTTTTSYVSDSSSTRRRKRHSRHSETKTQVSAPYKRQAKDNLEIATTTNAESSHYQNSNTTNTAQSIICYVSQGHAKRYKRLVDRLDYASSASSTDDNDDNENHHQHSQAAASTYRLFFHSYDKDCAGCLFQYHSTPAQGRNMAVKAAVTSPDWPKCKYLVVFDDDAYLVHDNTTAKNNMEIPKRDDDLTRQAWKDLHGMLLSNTTTYPIMSPQTPFDFTFKETYDTYQSCVDEVFWMIRRDIVDFVYPFSNKGGLNYWMTNVAMFYVMETCFPNGIWMRHDYKVYNPKHRYDTHYGSYRNETWQREILTDILTSQYYQSLGPWELDRPNQQGWKKSNSTLLMHRCNVTKVPPKVLEIDPKCKAIGQERFQKWLSGEYVP